MNYDKGYLIKEKMIVEKQYVISHHKLNIILLKLMLYVYLEEQIWHHEFK